MFGSGPQHRWPCPAPGTAQIAAGQRPGQSRAPGPGGWLAADTRRSPLGRRASSRRVTRRVDQVRHGCVMAQEDGHHAACRRARQQHRQRPGGPHAGVPIRGQATRVSACAVSPDLDPSPWVTRDGRGRLAKQPNADYLLFGWNGGDGGSVHRPSNSARSRPCARRTLRGTCWPHAICRV